MSTATTVNGAQADKKGKSVESKFNINTFGIDKKNQFFIFFIVDGNEQREWVDYEIPMPWGKVSGNYCISCATKSIQNRKQHGTTDLDSSHIALSECFL